MFFCRILFHFVLFNNRVTSNLNILTYTSWWMEKFNIFPFVWIHLHFLHTSDIFIIAELEHFSHTFFFRICILNLYIHMCLYIYMIENKNICMTSRLYIVPILSPQILWWWKKWCFSLCTKHPNKSIHKWYSKNTQKLI